MLEKLNIVKQRFDEVNDLIIQPEIISDQKRYIQLNKEYKDLSILMKKREAYIALQNSIDEAETISASVSSAKIVSASSIEFCKAI